MNDDQVLEQLSRTDVYAPGTLMPDLAWSRETALSEIERRMGMEPRKSTGQSTTTSDKQQRRDTAKPPVPDQILGTRRVRTARRRSKAQLVGVAAFVAVLATVVVVVAISAVVDQGDPGIVVAGISDDPAAAEAFKVVEAAFVAFNTGDVEAWIGPDDAGPPPRQWSLDYTAALLAADARIEVSQCESRGFGEWDRGDDGMVSGYLIICQATQRNLFYEAGELDPSVRYERVVGDGQVLSGSSDEAGFDDWLAFNTDFRTWMLLNHRDVFSEMRFLTLTTDFPAAESMPTALEYVNAFVADSPDWPKPSGS